LDALGGPGLMAATTPLHAPDIGDIVRVGTASLLERPGALADGVDALGALAGLRGQLSEAWVLATCNRLDLFAMAGDAAQAERAYEEVVVAGTGALRKLAAAREVSIGRGAVEYLYRVAAGLSTAVLGETEILGQIRTSADRAQAAGLLGPRLRQLAEGAVRTGRRVRKETAIGRGAGSYAAATLRVAERALGTLAGRPLLIVGAGDMARRIAKAAQHMGLGPITVANRTLAHAQRLARAVEGRALGLDELGPALRAHSLIIIALEAAPGLIPIAAVSAPGPKCVCDLSVPPVVAGLLPSHVSLHRLPDLVRELDQVLERRSAAIPAAEAIVQEEVRAFAAWLHARTLTSTVRALQARAEGIRLREFDKFSARLRALDPEQLGAVEHLSRAILRSTLHGPLASLRDPIHGESMAHALTRMFGLNALTSPSLTSAPRDKHRENGGRRGGEGASGNGHSP